jgi:hypothetical protein
MTDFRVITGTRVADPHHFNVDPVPISTLADPEPDPAPHQSDANLGPLVCRPSRAPF